MMQCGRGSGAGRLEVEHERE